MRKSDKETSKGLRAGATVRGAHTAGTSIPKVSPPTKLSNLLSAEADRLILEWATRNRTVLWLGGPSRAKIHEELVSSMRQFYMLAKEKYNVGTD